MLGQETAIRTLRNRGMERQGIWECGNLPEMWEERTSKSKNWKNEDKRKQTSSSDQNIVVSRENTFSFWLSNGTQKS